MTKKMFFIALPVCVLIALSAAFLFVSPAFAQDELPPRGGSHRGADGSASSGSRTHRGAPVEVLPTEAAPERFCQLKRHRWKNCR